ncbi:hypothetical protein RJ641_008620, partial [Dillenia turbinata]
MWEPNIPNGTVLVNASFESLYFATVDDPPDVAIIQAVEAPTTADAITLSFRSSKGSCLDHVLVDFTEVDELEIMKLGSLIFYVNGHAQAWANSQSEGTLTVELRPTEDLTLPPIISAIEVYMASDSLVTTGTSSDDLAGLRVFTSSFEHLKGWSGEPCLPSDTVWQWPTGSSDDPPRVTAIKLSGFGLDGPLPGFKLMKALETIDLGNNSDSQISIDTTGWVNIDCRGQNQPVGTVMWLTDEAI